MSALPHDGDGRYLPIRVAEFELTRPASVAGLTGYRALRVLIRFAGRPVGVVLLPVEGDWCTAETILRSAIDTLGWAITRHRLEQRLESGGFDARPEGARPLTRPARLLITAAVCTRNRPADLEHCLNALTALDPPADEILVIDNAPADGCTAAVAARYPSVRYAVEPTPGLDRARNRAIELASGDIIAFTDDDVVVDRRWTGEIVRAFEDSASVMAVTGLVQPLELETEAQEWFERYGGFGRGFERRWYRVPRQENVAGLHGGAGKFGTGANMAFRRTLFADIGGFDPALDVGTITNGGGDLDMFYRVLRAGYTLAYEPSAIVWHRHRRTYEDLAVQLTNNGIGFYSYLVRNAWRFPSERRAFVQLAAWWFRYWSLRRLALSYLKPGKFPRDLIVAELVGSLRGLTRYPRASRLAARNGTLSGLPAPRPGTGPVTAKSHSSPRQVRAEVIERFAVDLLRRDACERDADVIAAAVERLRNEFGISHPAPFAPLPSSIGAAVVLATYDRPQMLERCLASLTAQQTGRSLDIIVVDNHPGSGLTPPVVARFPGVRLIREPRAGLSFARNAGIRAATAPIIVATDDDVTAPPDWIERLVSPFRARDVMVVTGNVLPAVLATESERLFEAYGGLGRGTDRSRVDGDWFWAFRTAVPTWRLGATANAAFRNEIFTRPDIGMMDEALGAGTPTGCSEDTDMFYRVLRAGFAIAYEPDAFVWHHHRADMPALRRQLHAYARGHVAYHLTTLARDGDLRAAVRLLYELPRVYISRVRDRLRGRSDYPLPLIAVELAGTLIGPWAWWRSRRRAARLRNEDACAISGNSGSSRILASTSHGATGAPAGDGLPDSTTGSLSTSGSTPPVGVSPM